MLKPTNRTLAVLTVLSLAVPCILGVACCTGLGCASGAALWSQPICMRIVQGDVRCGPWHRTVRTAEGPTCNIQHTTCNMQRGAVRTRIRSNGCSTHSRTAVGWSDLQSPLRLGRCRTVSLRQHSLRCTAKDRSGLFLLALGSAGAQPAVAAVRLRCKLGVQEENEQHNQVQPCTTRAPRRTSARLGSV